MNCIDLQITVYLLERVFVDTPHSNKVVALFPFNMKIKRLFPVVHITTVDASLCNIAVMTATFETEPAIVTGFSIDAWDSFKNETKVTLNVLSYFFRFSVN